ncbi:hypothetical protein CHUAL_009766 [Chamberlinius hualienensis]
MKSKSDKVKPSVRSRLTQPKQLQCLRCRTLAKMPEKPTHQSKKSAVTLPKVANEAGRKFVPNIIINSSSHYIPIRTVSVLQDDAKQKLTKVQMSARGNSYNVKDEQRKCAETPVVLLGLTISKPQRVLTESKATNTVTIHVKRSNAGIQTLDSDDTEAQKFTQDVSIQTTNTLNVKLIEIKPPKHCSVQVLPSISILPPPKLNVHYLEMARPDFGKEIENKHPEILVQEDRNQPKVKSKELLLSDSEDLCTQSVQYEKSPETPHPEERCLTGISNPEDETLASQMSVLSYENVPQTPNRPASAPEFLLNSPTERHYHSVEVQYSMQIEEKAVQMSKTSPTLSKSISWSDLIQLSQGELPNRKIHQTYGDELSEGEVLPSKSRQELRKLKKPTVKRKQTDNDSDMSLGQIASSST